MENFTTSESKEVKNNFVQLISRDVVLPTEVNQTQNIVAWVIIGVCGLACTGLVILRYLIHDYIMAQWVQTMCIIPLVVVSTWFVYFTVALVRNLIGRRNAINRHDSFRLDLMIASLKVSIAGVIYTSFWSVLLIDSMVNFHSHLVQMLATIKLASTHLIYAGIFRSRMKPCIHNLIAGFGYISMGLIFEFLPETKLYYSANLLFGVACTLSALTEAIFGHLFLSLSIGIFGASFFLAAFEISRSVIAGVSLLGLALVLFILIPIAQGGLAAMTAMMFGSWTNVSLVETISGVTSSTSSSSSLTEEGDEQPLLTSRSEEEAKRFIVL